MITMKQGCSLLFFVIYVSISLAVRTDFMDQHCGGTIALSHEHAGNLELQFTPELQYSPYSDCYVTVTVEGDAHIHLIFLHIDITSYYHCPGDFLQIFDGLQVTNESFQFNDQVSGKKYCGDKVPESITSDSNNLTLRFVSDSAFHGKGFSVLLTAYHEGHCTDNEYQCSNSRCIHKSLYCDDFNHCGDDSDSCPLSILLIVGVVLSAFILLIAMLFLTIVLRYRCTSNDLQEDPYYDYDINDIFPFQRRLSTEALGGSTTDRMTISSISVITCDQTRLDPNPVNT